MASHLVHEVQDGLAKTFDMLLNEGDVLITETPTYSGALSAANATGAKIEGALLRASLVAVLIQSQVSPQMQRASCRPPSRPACLRRVPSLASCTSFPLARTRPALRWEIVVAKR